MTSTVPLPNEPTEHPTDAKSTDEQHATKQQTTDAQQPTDARHAIATSGPPRLETKTSDLDEGLRFLHAMSMQTKLSVERLDAMLTALSSELEARGAIDSKSVHDRLEMAHEETRARSREQLRVHIGPAVDKHTVRGSEIDCASRLPLCKGRCCRLTVHLGFQDLDDGLRWEYSRPYELKRDEQTNYCVYNVDAGCSIYEQRPTICRTYDCRNDKRIWDDFERRIPAAMTQTDRDPLLVQIQKSRLR